MPQPTVRSNVDAWVDEDHPNQNHAGASRIALRPNGSTQRMGYVFFARPFPFGCAVLEATLTITLKNSWASTRNVIVSRITQKWDENRIIWSNRPTITATNAVTKSGVGGADKKQIEIDVTDMMQDVASGGAWWGVRLETSGTGNYDLYSSDASSPDLGPKLQVRYAEAPAAPTGLRPSGGAAISDLKPHLEWDLPSQSRDDFQQVLWQAQISTTTDFTTPEWSSAEFSENPYLDLATVVSAYAGIPEGETRYWRVRVANADGVFSPWSDAAEFVRTSKGTLTLVSPGVGGTVEETTPPISWTFSGTQKSMSIELERKRILDGRTRWDLEWALGRRVTTDTSFNVPKDIIKSGRTYRVRVRVWDGVERQAVGGNPTFVQVLREFVYDRDGTPDPVEELTVERGDGPEAIITWTQTIEPDYFSLRVDGEEVKQRIEPANVRIGATNDFTLTWWRMEPGANHTVEIESVVNNAGKLHHSQDNPVETFKSGVGFKYLVDDSEILDPIVLQLYGKETSDFVFGETGETFNLVGERAPVRVIDSQRGWEGSLIGSIEGMQDLKKFKRMKKRMTEVRLIQSTLNIPVILGEASITPSPDAEWFDLSVEVFQSGEFSD